jgi:probable rRNA maturation factor
MSGELCLRNRQRVRAVDMRLLRRIVDVLLSGMAIREYDLTIQLVGEREMTRLNETRLRHAGSTDVITFDYGERGGRMAGEIFVCVHEALAQAARFQATWQEELVRYLVHGILHLQGFDDTRAAARRRMKREENRLVKKLGGDFRLSKLGGKPRVTA